MMSKRTAPPIMARMITARKDNCINRINSRSDINTMILFVHKALKHSHGQLYTLFKTKEICMLLLISRQKCGIPL